MYDEERRLRFLNTINAVSTRNFYASLFERIAPLEEELGMHIEDMSDEIAKPVFASFKLNRISSVKNTIERFQKYAGWLSENGIEFRPKLSYGAFGALSSIAEWMVPSPQALQSRLDKVFLKDDEKTSDNLCRVYLWLMFMGLPSDAAVDVDTKDVDLSVPCVMYNGAQYRVPPEAFTSFFVAATQSTFIVPHPIHEDAVMTRVNSEKLLRSVKSVPTKRTLENKILQKSSEAGESISPSDIAYSGVFYRAYLAEKQTGKADLSSYVMTVLAKSKVYDGLSHLQQQRRYHTVLSRVRRDYNNWKSAFDLS